MLKKVQPAAPKKASAEKSKKEIAKKSTPPPANKQPETAKKVVPTKEPQPLSKLATRELAAALPNLKTR